MPEHSSISFFLTLLLGLSFVVYGLMILFTSHMELEFKRYSLAHLRTLTGLMQLLGGLGSLLSLLTGNIWILLISSGGLALMMIGGVVVRLRLKDPLLRVFPAFIYALLAAYLFWNFVPF